jgi:hypothetical protein
MASLTMLALKQLKNAPAFLPITETRTSTPLWCQSNIAITILRNRLMLGRHTARDPKK